MGSNPAQGKLSLQHLLLKYDYWGCALSGFLSLYIYNKLSAVQIHDFYISTTQYVG